MPRVKSVQKQEDKVIQLTKDTEEGHGFNIRIITISGVKRPTGRMEEDFKSKVGRK